MTVVIKRKPHAVCGRFILLVLLSVMLSGCRTGSTSYERHNLSRLWVPDSADVIYFDVTATAKYPLDSAVAETTRQAWIEEWMSLRKLCNSGHEVVERRKFTRDDDNPYRHNLRYVLRCI